MPSAGNQQDAKVIIENLKKELQKAHDVIEAQSIAIQTLKKAAVSADHDDLEHSSEDESEANGTQLPKLFRDLDGLPRCSECGWEAVDGLCQSCETEHEYASDDEREALKELGPAAGTSTDHDMLNPDRQLAPRGTTPLLDVEPVTVSPISSNLFHPYVNRDVELNTLLTRGATKLMCVTFMLEYAKPTGIVAWADDALFDEFSGPGMKTGDRWKIHLGRRICLADDDLDGSAFVEELVEEAMIFPPTDRAEKGLWETVLEEGRTWVTRPAVARPSTEGGLQNAGEDQSTDEEYDSDDSLTTYTRGYRERLDRALEVTSDEEREQRASALFVDEYADSEPEDDMDLDSDPDWLFGADRVFDSTEDDDESQTQETGAAGAISTSGAGPPVDSEAVDEGIMSDADSDFDSDETMSGDEVIIEESREHIRRVNMAAQWPREMYI
ncbi:hypothetical protein FA95DRAFT_1682221 [Auriscalpium vulgare]|uniref:Uncharacterized protein n=1 Tax=Auriscalpium vulgare TaxID=40419 RepID=A0ACB8RG99_9AGAM|nr:hypothetical protein FA95DRAFT_1682221 [Auriscalpium vulgare]